jgi:hypothetical protein
VGNHGQDGPPARFGDGPQGVVHDHRPHRDDHEPSSNQATSVPIERPLEVCETLRTLATVDVSVQ